MLGEVADSDFVEASSSLSEPCLQSLHDLFALVHLRFLGFGHVDLTTVGSQTTQHRRYRGFETRPAALHVGTRQFATVDDANDVATPDCQLLLSL